MFFHEQLYRSQPMMSRLRDYSITVCGAGALGANMVENLARSGFGKLKVIDRDRIEERNLSTQPYYKGDIGAFKAKVLANSLYRSLGTTVDAQTKELTADNVVALLKDSRLVLELFDNSVARGIVKDYCDRANLPCLHVGLASDYAEVLWNEVYRVPSAANDDVCDYPLARNLVLLAVAIASEVVIQFVTKGEKQNFTITLGDFAVKPYES